MGSETPRLFAPRPVINSADTVFSDLKSHAEKCMFDIFVYSYRLDSVGSKDNVEAICDVNGVYKKISSISHQFRYPISEHRFILMPDILNDQYLEYIPNIPSDTTKWKIHLRSQYYQVLVE